jgi:hypothetical protein
MVALDSASRSLIALQITCVCVDTVVVALRFLARFWKGQRISWDDGFMLVAWAALMGYLVILIKSKFRIQ